MEIAEAIGNDYSASLLANDAQFVLLRIFVRWIINEVRVVASPALKLIKCLFENL